MRVHVSPRREKLANGLNLPFFGCAHERSVTRAVSLFVERRCPVPKHIGDTPIALGLGQRECGPPITCFDVRVGASFEKEPHGRYKSTDGGEHERRPADALALDQVDLGPEREQPLDLSRITRAGGAHERSVSLAVAAVGLVPLLLLLLGARCVLLGESALLGLGGLDARLLFRLARPRLAHLLLVLLGEAPIFGERPLEYLFILRSALVELLQMLVLGGVERLDFSLQPRALLLAGLLQLRAQALLLGGEVGRQALLLRRARLARLAELRLQPCHLLAARLLHALELVDLLL